jgi:Protein of unknown function (DUF3237)
MVSVAQGQVSLSGQVKDSRTTLPISGANVQIAGLRLTGTTDTAGRFALTGTSGIHASRNLMSLSPDGSARNLEYRHAANGPVSIRILDLAGAQHATVFSGILPRGTWRVRLPALTPGLYVCAIEAAGSRESIRFFASANGQHDQSGETGMLPQTERSSGVFPAGLSKLSAEVQVVDTLFVTQSGYRKASLPLTSFQQSGLNILLEKDSADLGTEDATLVPDPSWTCFMPAGIPPPALGEATFTLTFQIGAVRNVGRTKYGQRRQYDISGGTIAGDRINGTALSGGLDYELTLSNGSTEVEQIIILRANSIPILMRNAGVAPVGEKNARVVLDFEAPNSSAYAWLNTGKFAATSRVDTAAKTIRMDVYDISKVSATTKRIQIQDPSDSPHQTWECFQMTGNQGTTVLTANVTLGASISIGASKRGNRNIIPITGGTTSGRVVGKVLSGGADFQLTGLDARYTLAPNDGEYIIIRNCGSNGLIPVFEARTDGPYAFLNENKYLSSPPGVGSGGVTITFYEKR